MSMSVRLKNIIRPFVPPIIVSAARRMQSHNVAALPVPPSQASAKPAQGAPPSPEWEAIENCEAIWTANEGWSHESIAALQRRKWPHFLESVQGARPFGWSHETAPNAPTDVSTHNMIVTFGQVLGRAACGRPRLSVLDWGGGIGHYAVYARTLHPDLELAYTIADLPPLCRAGREVLPDVTFIDSAETALSRTYDLVFASSSVQYTRDLYGLLEKLCAAAGGYFMVTRSPFVEKQDDFVVVQRPYAHGYMTEYPAWFINRGRFLSFVAAQGFVLEREFLLAERPYVPNAPEQCKYCGFLFRRTRERP